MKKNHEINRRHFIGTVAAATAGVAVSGFTPVLGNSGDTADKLAILGDKSDMDDVVNAIMKHK